MKKKFAVLIMFIGLIFLLGFLVIFPLFKDIREKSAGLVSEKEKLSQLYNNVDDLKMLQNSDRENQARLETIDNLFLDPEMPLDFIEFLEGEAKNSGLSINISPGSFQKIKGDPWPFFRLSLFLNGFFPNFLKFFERLENGSYLIEVFNLTAGRLTDKEAASKESKNLSVGEVGVNLSIDVYTR